jgi:hypothetical protein
MPFCVTKRVMSFLEAVVTDRAEYAAYKMLLGNREPEVRARLCTLLHTSISAT